MGRYFRPLPDLSAFKRGTFYCKHCDEPFGESVEYILLKTLANIYLIRYNLIKHKTTGEK
jgi:hypothetical protein